MNGIDRLFLTVFVIAFVCVLNAEAKSSKLQKTPSVLLMVQDELNEDRRGVDDAPRAQNDGKSVVFTQGANKITSNNKEITLLQFDRTKSILELSDFLYRNAFKQYLEKKLTNNKQLTDGDLELLGLVYNVEIEALRVITSYGYQAAIFHQNINSKAYAAQEEIENPVFSSGTIVDDTKQVFYDESNSLNESIMAWGRNIFEKDSVDLLKNIVTGEDSRASRKMRIETLNEAFYILPHVIECDDFLPIRERDVTSKARMENWLTVHNEVMQRISRLHVLKARTHNWSQAAPQSTFKKVFEEKKDIWEEKNRNVVLKAREIFYDFPIVVANVEYKEKLADARHFFMRNDITSMKRSSAEFIADIAGDEMLSNFKSSYTYDAYLVSLEYLKDRMDIEEYEDILTSLNMKRLKNVAEFKSSAGSTLWTKNELEGYEAKMTEFNRQKAKEKEEFERAERARKEEFERAERARKEEFERQQQAKKDEERARKEEFERAERARKEEFERQQQAKKEAERERARQEVERKRIEAERERAEREAKAEQERIEREAKAEQERIKRAAELEKLRIEKEERLAKEKMEREEREEKARLEQEKQLERERLEAEQRKLEREEKIKQIELKRAEMAAAEAEARAKAEAEARAKAEAEAKAKAEAEAEVEVKAE